MPVWRSAPVPELRSHVIFRKLQLQGAVLIELEPRTDERGFFARTFCADEFAQAGLNTSVVQCNVSFNKRKGTLRGMHYQKAPYEEAKLVRCTSGAIFDAIIDLRPGSPTFKRHFSVILSAENRTALYVPEGFAHGFQTLRDDTEVFYQMSQRYQAEAAAGVRWNDPSFAIEWPADERTMSERDRSYPDYRQP
jgi:dTDP-4-dehydrorhamnose 3,5-epimerase